MAGGRPDRPACLVSAKRGELENEVRWAADGTDDQHHAGSLASVAEMICRPAQFATDANLAWWSLVMKTKAPLPYGQVPALGGATVASMDSSTRPESRLPSQHQLAQPEVTVARAFEVPRCTTTNAQHLRCAVKPPSSGVSCN